MVTLLDHVRSAIKKDTLPRLICEYNFKRVVGYSHDSMSKSATFPTDSICKRSWSCIMDLECNINSHLVENSSELSMSS